MFVGTYHIETVALQQLRKSKHKKIVVAIHSRKYYEYILGYYGGNI